MQRELKITITGEACSGKTTARAIIEKALQANGFNVVMEPNNQDGDLSSKRLRLLTLGHLECPSLHDVNVTFTEQQLRRMSVSSEEIASESI